MGSDRRGGGPFRCPAGKCGAGFGCSFSASAPRDPVSFQTSGSVSHFCKPYLRRLQDFPAFPSCFFIACMILPKLDKSIHFFSPSAAMGFYFAGGPLLICHSTQPTDGQSVVKVSRVCFVRGVKVSVRSSSVGGCVVMPATRLTPLSCGKGQELIIFWKWFKGFGPQVLQPQFSCYNNHPHETLNIQVNRKRATRKFNLHLLLSITAITSTPIALPFVILKK